MGDSTLAAPHPPLHNSAHLHLLRCLQSAQAVQAHVVDGVAALVPQLCCAASLFLSLCRGGLKTETVRQPRQATAS